jgi:hypothetical protein
MSSLITGNKLNCYKCIHRSQAIVLAHSSCNHPATTADLENTYANIMAVLASRGHADPIVSTDVVKQLNIKLNEEGIANGSANFPWDYNPVWVKNCNGFEEIKLPKVTLDKSEIQNKNTELKTQDTD